MSFWDKVFDTPPAPRSVTAPTTPRAWWQDQNTVQSLVNSSVQGDEAPPAQGYGLTDQEIKAIRKRGHQQINADQAEQIAEYDLSHKDKYLNECPECGSGNFIPAGTRVQAAGVRVMPTDKCFDCGYSARAPERVVGASNGSGGSISTRQIDTGGGGGNMFMKLSGTPQTYMPRNN